MKLQDIFEDAENDLWATNKANELLNSLIRFVYAKKHTDFKFEFTYIVIDGKTHKLCCVTNDDFDFPPIFKKTIIAFRPTEYYRSGGLAIAYPYHVDNTHDKAIVLNIPIEEGEDGSLPNIVSPTDVYKALLAARNKDVFRHELQHVIDYKRYKGNLHKKERARSTQGSKYYNDDLELNAFFHNFAEPILERLRFIHTKNVDATIYQMLFPEMTRDFREFLSDRLNKNHGVLKRFWDHLREANRRRAISRLKNLFDLYWRTVDALPKVDDKGNIVDDKYPNSSSEGNNVQSS